jgi:hypothetical protein
MLFTKHHLNPFDLYSSIKHWNYVESLLSLFGVFFGPGPWVTIIAFRTCEAQKHVAHRDAMNFPWQQGADTKTS